jgi:hypothetical protein
MRHERHDESMRPGTNRGERGSALVLAVFVLVLLTSMGIALLFVSEGEMASSQANLRHKKAFFVAEAGLEDGRATLYDTNRNNPFDDDLITAAGPDGVMDFDADNVTANYDTDGNFTGFTVTGDDVPVRAGTVFGEGNYVAYLTNDPVDGRTNLTDSNNRVLLTGIAAGESDRSYEVVEAIVELRNIMPTIPPATITLLGPSPAFASGTSATKDFIGTDCGGTGGVPGLYVPVVGTIGASAESAAESGLHSNPDFVSGSYTDHDVFADLTDPTEPTVAASYGPIDSRWQDCQHIETMVETLREAADFLCEYDFTCAGGGGPGSCGTCDPRNTFPNAITFVDGDYDVGGTMNGQGTLVVTGTLILGGGVSWDGLILVFGEGDYRLNGAGNGEVTGGMMVANIAGPDGAYGKTCSTGGGHCRTDADCNGSDVCVDNADNCTGSTDGFLQPVFDERGGGNAGTIYCTTSLDVADPVIPYPIVEFRQW